MPTGDPTTMLAALSAGDRAGALEAALQAYFGPAVHPRRSDLPSALATLFTRFERGMIRQNHLKVPALDRVFYVENQSCCQWALADASDDPQVVRDATITENETLSGFAIQLVAFEASMGGLEWHVGGPMNAQGRSPLLTGLHELPLLPWTWPNDGVRFFVAPGIVAHADGVAVDETWVFASATSRELLLDLARRNGINWTDMNSLLVN